MPVPRGRFGFGAPPAVDGPRKRGELYGNRIPVPSRTVSGGNFPLSRPTSYDQRRSFSSSIVLADFDDDHLDFSPMSSPTLTSTSLPPDSPDSIASTPDISPSFGEFSNPKQNITRATSFAQALEVARKAEMEKQERQNTINLTSRSPPRSADDGHGESPIETTPTIVVSSEDVSSIMVPEIPIANATSVPSTTPRDSPSLERVQPNEELSYKPPTETVVANGASPGIMTTTHNPLMTKDAVRNGTPPLNIRKRAPTISIPSVVDQAPKDPGADTVPTEPQVIVSPIPQVKLHDVSAWISDTHKEETVYSLPIIQHVELDEPVPNENMELKLSAPEILPTPDIVILNEQPEENIQEPDDAKNDLFTNSNVGVRSRKLGLTLDSEKLGDGSLMSPPPQSGMLKTFLKKLTLNFVIDPELYEATTAPPVLDSFSKAAHAITSPSSFLSPPDTGLHSPSSGSSALSSRPMSMIESSPKVVTQMLRMTPATSRGVPMFLPGSQAPTRKSDFVYFPPTPEDEDTDLGSLTTQNSSPPTRMRSGSDPEDIRNMPSKQTFSAVVHRKVRETPVSATVPDNKIRPLPQTPQARRAQRATILETPLSPGHGELAALLHEAVLLENTLNKGELPSEDPQFKEEALQKEKAAKEEEAEVVESQAKAKVEDEERSRITLANTQLESKRDEPTAGRLKHTFLIPLSKARSRHRKEVYTAKAESFFSRSEEPSLTPIQPKSAGLPSQSTTNSFAIASATLPRMPTEQPSIDGVNSTAQLPVKSPKFSSLRKFSSVSRAGGGASIRSHSTSSEISEETSSSVTIDEFGRGTGSTLSFPSVSPKKASSTLARATSFAGKLFNRGRTKSSGSTLSSTSEVLGRSSFYPNICQSLIIYLDHHVGDDSPIKTPVPMIAPIVPTSLGISVLPSQPEVPAFSFDEPPLRRSTSSKRSAIYFSSGPDSTGAPQLPSVLQITSQTSSSSLLPISNDSTPPSSATSLSSVSSLPSPLFNQELVDAFPSVPATTPTSNNFSHREMSFATTATPTKASFDSALLSSAIHLTSTYKTATPKAKTKPLPSERSATPTSISRT